MAKWLVPARVKTGSLRRRRSHHRHRRCHYHRHRRRRPPEPRRRRRAEPRRAEPRRAEPRRRRRAEPRRAEPRRPPFLSAESRPAGFRCQFCGLSFSMNWLRRRHERSVHQEVSEHVCFVCRKSYSRKDSLREHMRRFHSMEVTSGALMPPL